MRSSDIRIRDPFIVRDGNYYYLFGTTDKNCWNGKAQGFDMYKSGGDLEKFDGPFPAFRPPSGFWSDTHFWAPEVYRYRDDWFMFASFLVTGGRRGTAVLKSRDGVEGPYKPWSDGPVTPKEWECLDGTLYVDKDGKPWMVFCHEWVQIEDGEICLISLSEDLRIAVGEAVCLFRASDAPWVAPIKEESKTSYVTDGPYIYTAENGSLLMLWSSFGFDGNYCMGLAVSESGCISGPWRQQNEPLYSSDGGHGMLFKTSEGKLYLTLHQPNTSPNERPIFIEMKEPFPKLG
jgi:beta-xylosidase